MIGMRRLKLVIKVGGSLSIGKNGPNKRYFRKFVPVLKKIAKRHQIIVVIGGGRFIRNYYRSIRKLGLSSTEMEWIAIELLRVNVRFLAFLLRKEPIYSLKQLNSTSSGVIGGIVPGRSTDANAAIAAKIIRADMLIKLTNVDGIYTKDPNKFRNAKKIRKIKFGELKKYTKGGKPGSYGIFDKMAANTIRKHHIKTVIMSGRDPRDLLKLLDGKKLGTVISD